MNFEKTRKNPYTYHHIKEVRNGGLCVIDNGAIITRDAHNYLNYLCRTEYMVYKKLNKLFKLLNETQEPPTILYYEELDFILSRVRK